MPAVYQAARNADRDQGNNVVELKGRPWVEKLRGGKYRPRWREVNKRTPAAGPVFTTEESASAYIRTRWPWLDAPQDMASLIDDWVASCGNSPYACETRDRLAKLTAERGWLTPERITVHEVERWNVEAGGRGLTTPGPKVARLWRTLATVLRWARDRYRVPIDQCGNRGSVLGASAPLSAAQVSACSWTIGCVQPPEHLAFSIVRRGGSD